MRVALVLALLLTTGVAGQDRGLLPDASGSGRRLALVIGNGAYTASPLGNPVNDAIDMAEELQRLKFDAVRLAVNTSKVDLQRVIDEFVRSVQSGDVVLFYYSGHGIQIGGENYLLPVDYAAQDEAEARFEGYSAALLHDRLTERGARLRILILDACRNNPFRTSRAAGAGLAPMAAGGKGSFIAFATGPNSTADDNSAGRNGLFTTYLLEAMRQPALSLDQMVSFVRVRVDQASNGRQTPWTNSSVIGDFYFQAPLPGAVAALPPPLAVPAPAPRAPVDPRTAVQETLNAYRAAYEARDVDALRRVYPSFENFEELRKRFADLQGVAVAMGAPQITIRADGTATAVSLYSMTFTATNGRSESTRPSRAEFQLRRNGAAWIIESLIYR